MPGRHRGGVVHESPAGPVAAPDAERGRAVRLGPRVRRLRLLDRAGLDQVGLQRFRHLWLLLGPRAHYVCSSITPLSSAGISGIGSRTSCISPPVPFRTTMLNFP